MEAEAPILFHSAFTLIILVSSFLMIQWSKGVQEKTAIKAFLCFFLLQVPVYGLLFFSLVMATTSENLTFTFGMAGLIWALSILVLVGGIQRILKK